MQFLLITRAQADAILKSSTEVPLVFAMVLTSDHTSPATGLSPTVTISKNAGAFASPAGAVSEIGNGWYKIAANATDTNTLGPLLVYATAGTADQAIPVFYTVVAYDPQAATNLGLSALPTATAAASGGLLTYGSSTGQLNPTSGAMPLTTGQNVATINSLAPPTNWATTNIDSSGRVLLQPSQPSVVIPTVTTLTNAPSSLLTANSGTAQAGAASTITLAAGASATTDIYKGNYVAITSGTGAGQSRVITGYVGGTLVATVSRAWTTNPDNTSVYSVMENPHPAMDTNLAVTAGTVSDKTGYTASTVSDKTGYTVSTVQDKTGYSLTSGEHTSIQTDAATGILVTPSQKVATNASNQVVSSSVQGNVTGSVASVSGAVGSVTAGVTVTTNNDKTGYTASTVSDKTGYSLSGSEHTAIATDTQTGLTAQGYTTARAAKIDNADVATSSRLASGNVTVGSYAGGQDPATLVLGATAASWNTASTIGNKINSAGAYVDPWGVSLPGAYGAGTAGIKVGTDLDAAISSRLAASGYTVPPTAAANASALLGTVVDGSITVAQYFDYSLSFLLGTAANSFNTGTHTLSTAYKNQEATQLFTNNTVYAGTAATPPVTSRSSTIP
jgi:hypothetical protein